MSWASEWRQKSSQAGFSGLTSRPEQKKLDIILGDFVKAELPYFDVCISNTPYQVCFPSAAALSPLFAPLIS